MTRGIAIGLLLLSALAAAASACEEERQGAGAFAGPRDLRGRTIGVAALDGIQAVETRYVLQEAFGLDAAGADSEVTLMEAPADSLPGLLRDGEIDAIVLPQRAAYALLEEGDVEILSHVTQEMRKLTGDAVLASVLVTYPDAAQEKGAALSEVAKLLAESVTYFHANRGEVINAVAAGRANDAGYLGWWWDRHDLRFGDRTPQSQVQLVAVWQAGQAVADLPALLQPARVFFSAATADTTAQPKGTRSTVTLAVLDDLSRRTALYAIEQRIITSDAVDLSVTYLPPSAIAEAAPAKQYDVIEVSSLLVAVAAGQEVEFLVLSEGLEDRDGTLLLVARRRPAD